MKYNPDKHHRQSTRLREYDYSSAGAYFITLCTHQKRQLFGDLVEGNMVLNDMGKIIDEEWSRSAEIRKEIELDEFVIMPNHMHGIVWILPPSHDVVVNNNPTSLPPNVGVHGRAPLQLQRKPKSLSSFIAGFKSVCTKRINELRQMPKIPLWQVNYHDRIIRNDKELNNIRQYIQLNLQNWETDKENQ